MEHATAVKLARPPGSRRASLRMFVVDWTCVVSFFYLLLSATDACFKQSSSSSQKQGQDSDHATAMPTVPPSHQLPCFTVETQTAACLNGGQCFATLTPSGDRQASCRCVIITFSLSLSLSLSIS